MTEDIAALIERLKERYMDTKKMVPCQLEHEAATALAAQSERIAALEKERDDLRRSVRNFGTLQHEFMNRTEAAEAQLAKAVEALTKIMDEAEFYPRTSHVRILNLARATLAEIEGDAPTPTRAEKLEAVLQGIIDAYIAANPLRTADFHSLGCSCVRCKIDEAAATLAEIGGDAAAHTGGDHDR